MYSDGINVWHGYVFNRNTVDSGNNDLTKQNLRTVTVLEVDHFTLITVGGEATAQRVCPIFHFLCLNTEQVSNGL